MRCPRTAAGFRQLEASTRAVVDEQPQSLVLDMAGDPDEVAEGIGIAGIDVSLEALVSGFVQIIEWKASKIDEVNKFIEEWRVRFPEMGPSRVLECADRDNNGQYMTVVEFPSYEEAMRNNDDPATKEFSDAMMALADGPPTFHNLDVINLHER